MLRNIIVLSVLASTTTGCGAIGLFYPPMKVYLAEVDGRAKLAEAEFEKQTRVEEARADLEASKFKASAEIERAKGVAAANKIIGDSLAGNEAYLRYLWIQGLQDGSSEVIYIPTEANLPILEAGKGRKR